MEVFDVYKDIQARTNGEIYLGVVGPVRTGKSTFIKRFMDLLVLPKIEDEHSRQRTKDELPQSASGKTIMTTEPKFVPKEAAEISLMDDVTVKVRLIDCVGYMVKGAAGHTENEEERQVKTPWFDYEIPFTKAASIGTQKVIHDHATIGIVITTDGTICDLKREDYLEAEDKTIRELQSIGKPFVVLVNSQKPYAQTAKEVTDRIKEKYGVTAMAINCEQLREEDVHRIMEQVLFEFPISEVEFYIPKWVEMLSREHKIKADLLLHIKHIDLMVVQSVQSRTSRRWHPSGGCTRFRVANFLFQHFSHQVRHGPNAFADLCFASQATGQADLHVAGFVSFDPTGVFDVTFAQYRALVHRSVHFIASAV